MPCHSVEFPTCWTPLLLVYIAVQVCRLQNHLHVRLLVFLPLLPVQNLGEKVMSVVSWHRSSLPAHTTNSPHHLCGAMAFYCDPFCIACSAAPRACTVPAMQIPHAADVAQAGSGTSMRRCDAGPHRVVDMYMVITGKVIVFACVRRRTSAMWSVYIGPRDTWFVHN